jgi:hypothetical protein
MVCVQPGGRDVAGETHSNIEAVRRDVLSRAEKVIGDFEEVSQGGWPSFIWPHRVMGGSPDSRVESGSTDGGNLANVQMVLPVDHP